MRMRMVGQINKKASWSRRMSHRHDQFHHSHQVIPVLKFMIHGKDGVPNVTQTLRVGHIFS
jgi:hypothetical protein